MKSIVISAVGLFALTGAASAADLPARTLIAPPLVEPAVNWTGFYVGVLGGYSDTSLQRGTCVGICTPPRVSAGTGYAAAEFGYDYQFANRVVLGAFGTIPFVQLGKTVSLIPGIADFPLKTTFVGIGGARLGYAFDRLMPFVFGGYTYARTEVFSTFNGIRQNKSHDGFVVGAGVEYALTRNLFVEANYSYLKLEKQPYNFGGGITDWRSDAHNFSGGLKYKFGL